MKNRQPQTGHATSMVRGIAAGTAVSLTITFLLAALLTKMLEQEILVMENVGYTIIASILTASFMGSYYAYKKIKHQRFTVCMLSGLVYWSALACITALFYKGTYQGILITSVIILAGSLFAFIMSAPVTHRKKIRTARIYHR